MPKEIIINSRNAHLFVEDKVIDGERKARGLMPRNFATHPVGYGAYAPAFDIDLIPESEWQDRLDEQIKNKAQLSDIRNTGMGGKPIPSRDQDGYGYCWAHSSTSAALLIRALNNEPYADLSAFAVACIIKNYRNQGGWGAESLEFIAERGIPTSEFWPQKSVSRANDNPKTWENAARHKFTEWMDLDPRDMKRQLVACLLLNIPIVSDFSWWTHSVCSVDLVSLSPFRTRIWNSWSDSWSSNGMGILEGKRAIPDAAIAPRVMTASTV
jgi:hypothetical protein